MGDVIQLPQLAGEARERPMLPPAQGPDDEWELDVSLSELAWVNTMPCALMEAAA